MDSDILRYTVFPKRILLTGGALKNEESLLKEKRLQIGLNESDVTEINNGFILLDFGTEISGGVRILTSFASKELKIRIRTGESLSEAMSEINKKGSSNDHALRDMTVRLVSLSDMTFLDTGFRFVRIDFFGEASIKSITASCKIFSAVRIYDYKGSDTLVKKIFDTAAHTVDLCMSSGYLWDGVKRDRLVWIGDMHPEMLAVTALYGRHRIIEDSLDSVLEQYPLPNWMNGMPSYSVWWIIILTDYYKLTLCGDYVKKQLDYLKQLLIQIDGCVNCDGAMNFPGYFVDWPTHGKADEESGVRALNIIAQSKAKELLNVFGENTEICDKILDKLRKKPIKVVRSKQVAALKYFAENKLSLEEIKLLTDGGAKGLSTFMSYYILKAIAETSGVQTASDIMKEYYGEMLKLGATSFWEDFDVCWGKNASPIDRMPKTGECDIHGDFGDYCYKGFRHSLCHGWSAGVIKFIEEYL